MELPSVRPLTVWPLLAALQSCVCLGFAVYDQICTATHIANRPPGCSLRFTFSGFNPSSLVIATERAAKASLISNTSTSSRDQPAFAT